MFSFGRALLWSALMASVLACGLMDRASAQCFPDNLDTATCCTPTAAILPTTFPFIQGNGRFICFRNCNVAVNAQLCTVMGPAQPAMVGGNPVCGVYIMRFQLKTCGSNLVVWSGNMRLHYSRNWQELGPPGTVRTIWRFLANGDLTPTAALPTGPNIRPPCVANFGTAYFSGYFDFAFDCNTSTWDVAWALNHECDFATHAVGTSRPITSGSHPTRSYVFVGPAAGFVASSTAGPFGAGGLTFDALRKNNWPAVPNICLGEEPLGAGGTMIPVRFLCECNPSNTTLPRQYAETALTGGGICGSTFNTLNPPIGPIPFVQKNIGSWTTAGTYPNQTTLLFALGTMQHFDGCAGVNSTQYFEGVETLGNSSVIGVGFNGVAYGSQFVDLGSSNTVSGATIISKPHVTWFLLNLNL